MAYEMLRMTEQCLDCSLFSLACK